MAESEREKAVQKEKAVLKAKREAEKAQIKRLEQQKKEGFK